MIDHSKSVSSYRLACNKASIVWKLESLFAELGNPVYEFMS